MGTVEIDGVPGQSFGRQGGAGSWLSRDTPSTDPSPPPQDSGCEELES